MLATSKRPAVVFRASKAAEFAIPVCQDSETDVFYATCESQMPGKALRGPHCQVYFASSMKNLDCIWR